MRKLLIVILAMMVLMPADGKKKKKMPKEKDLSAYLMVYHLDADHGLHMAISYDGYTFTALNDNNPIFAGDTIAEQKGIRDPHIFRGPDGAFYLAMTDLNIFAKQSGYRSTEWERDGAKYGWGNNRGLVLMKSFDLEHWSRANIDFTKIGPEYEEIGCVWAPEMIYDDEKGKIMIYYTMRMGNGMNSLYYVYVNDDFNQLLSKPEVLFHAPDYKYSVIDGDIAKWKGQYHLHYVSHEKRATVKHAVSDHLTYGYMQDNNYDDGERAAHEAPNTWRRIGTNTWVVMYDVYGVNPHNFGFTETQDFISYKSIGRFNEGVMKTTNFSSPKHGAVVPITKKEASTLERLYMK